MEYIPRRNKDGTLTGNFINKDFPKDFYFGSAVSSYQVEGGNRTDWSLWEEARNDKEYICGDACDFVNKYPEALGMAKEMGHNAFRFSIEWKRIEPIRGQYSLEGINFYKGLIAKCKSLGLEPFITIWHWTNPDWTVHLGGWESKEVQESFDKYVEFLVNEIGKEAKYWMTLNEPVIWLTQSYLQGRWPPQKRNIFTYFRLNNILMNKHKYIYKKLKEVNPNSIVGIAHQISWNKLVQKNIFTILFKKYLDYYYHENFLNGIIKYLDFIGVNYYFTNYIFLSNEDRNIIPKSDMGWDLIPEGLAEACKYVSKYNKPMYITEHGLADKENKYRKWYIDESLRHLKKGIDNGLDIRGYLHWSLLDNFEWSDGYGPKFGLIEVKR